MRKPKSRKREIKIAVAFDDRGDFHAYGFSINGKQNEEVQMRHAKAPFLGDRKIVRAYWLVATIEKGDLPDEFWSDGYLEDDFTKWQ